MVLRSIQLLLVMLQMLCMVRACGCLQGQQLAPCTAILPPCPPTELHKAGIDAAAQDRLGRTALHVAAQHGSVAAITALIQCNVPAATLDDRGRAACQVASSDVPAALVDTMRSAALAQGWVDNTAGDSGSQSVSRLDSSSAEAAAEAGTELVLALDKALSSGLAGDMMGDDQQELLQQYALVAGAALHEKVAASVRAGLLGGFGDIYRALDEDGRGFFNAQELEAGCVEIGIPMTAGVSPCLMALITHGDVAAPAPEGVTWPQFEQFCAAQHDADTTAKALQALLHSLEELP